ncbi:uncharacterized protein [Amphiura filiformis]|uniref:uncharacterized protein n=1 Tax=Amphiura filiformis TaxID=82378 RepID=UPI003B2121FA
MATDVLNPSKPHISGGARMPESFPQPSMVTTSRPTGSNVVSTSGVLCAVCCDQAAGRYFGAQICEACKSFFIRSTKKGQPNFRCINNQRCDVTPTSRLLCQYCRYQKCLEAGMCRKAKQPTKEPSPDRLPCKVCGDVSSGIHFGVYTCEGCKGFFRRSLKDGTSYSCSGKEPNSCSITPTTRNSCRRCRFYKCIDVGMSRAGIKLGRHQKYLTGPGGSIDGDPSINIPRSPSFLNQPTNSYLPSQGVAGRDASDAHNMPNNAPTMSPSNAGMESTYTQMNNYDARKDFCIDDFNMTVSSSLMSGATAGMNFLHGIGNNMDGHIEGPNSRMSPHGYPGSGLIDDRNSPLMTSPPPLTSNSMYSPKGHLTEMKTMDPLSYAISQTIGAQENTPMLELLNSSLDSYAGGMKNARYQPDMSNMMSSIPAINGFNSSMRYSTSNVATNKPSQQQDVKLEHPFAECQEGKAPSSNSRQNITGNTNMVSSTSIDEGKQKNNTPCSSGRSSPFSEYEGDDNDTCFNIDSTANGSGVDPNQSIPRPSDQSFIQQSQSGADNSVITTTTGSSLLMGNHWTSHTVHLQEVLKQDQPLVTNKQAPPLNEQVSPINFELMVNSDPANPDDSRKRKSSKDSLPELMNQMPELGEDYLAMLQQRIKMGCRNGEVLSVESEARLREIQDPINDLDRGSIMFELSHGYGALVTKMQQINLVPEKGKTQKTEGKGAEEDFKDIMGAKLIAMVAFVKDVPGFRALSMKDQMILVRFGLFTNHMITFGTDLENEGQWFISHFLDSDQSWHALCEGMEKYVLECFDHFRQVQLDRIQTPLLMALVVFNPDLPSLVSRDMVLKRHHILRQILKQYCIEKYGNLSLFHSIMSLVPDLFLVEYYHKRSVKQGIAFMSDVALPALFAEINL